MHRWLWFLPLILALGGALLWRDEPQASGPPPSPSEVEKRASLEREFSKNDEALPPPEQPAAVEDALRLAPLIPLQTGDLPWERQIAAIRENRTFDDAARGRQLFALLPNLPEEALGAAAEAAVEDLRDQDFAQSAAPILVRPQTHGAVVAVLFEDLMRRSNEVALPCLLQMARDASHPFAAHARENLALLLGKEHGQDWQKWEGAIQHALAAPTEPR